MSTAAAAAAAAAPGALALKPRSGPPLVDSGAEASLAAVEAAAAGEEQHTRSVLRREGMHRASAIAPACVLMVARAFEDTVAGVRPRAIAPPRSRRGHRQEGAGQGGRLRCGKQMRSCS